jgi:enolase
MPTVTHLEALEVLDSRGSPTLEVSCVLDGGVRGNAAVPVAGTPGRAEVIDLRDEDPARHRGGGRRKAVALVEGEIRTALAGKRFPDQTAFDRALTTLDGTAKLSRLGGNTICGISLAFARAQATAQGAPLFRHFAELVGKAPVARLPLPIVSLFSGDGGDPTDRGPLGLAFVPTAATTVDEAVALSAVLAATAEATARGRYDMGVGMSSDGGIRAPFFDTDSMLDLALKTVRSAEREPGRDVRLVLLGAASRRFEKGWYRIDREKLTPREVIDRYVAWTGRYPVFAVEDPLGEEDWEGWTALAAQLKKPGGQQVTLAGDELLCTNSARIQRAVTQQACNALILKPSQCGTLSAAAEALRAARKAEWTVIVAGRTGETEDDWLTDLAVGWGAEHLQVGGIRRSERLAKYNRLLAIEKKTHWPLHRL